MVRTIEEIDIQDVEKRRDPSKHYVYVIYVTWSDGSTNIIYRRYSRFFDFQSSLMEMFPEEAGSIDPSKRIIPFLPGKKFFGRSHIREVAVKRLGPIADYCKQIVKLPRKISQCKEVLEFFEMDHEDMNPQKGKKASMKAKKISTPKPLEVYIACTEYTKQEKGEVTLKLGMVVEVVEKTETGWWFVNADEEQGWVPSTCLQREDGETEESAVRYKPGQEEQYLCTEEFKGEGPDEISMERGAVVDVIEKNLEGWWLVRYNGREGYVPATYLMKTEAFQVRKKSEQVNIPRKPDLVKTNSGGPQIVKSLHEVSNLLGGEQKMNTVAINIDNNDDDSDFDSTYHEPEEEKIYTIHEISRILKENKTGDRETEKINQDIKNIKSRSLKRGGSVRPPPRPSIKPESPRGVKPALARLNSLNLDYITIADFDDAVGDGISFTVGQHVKVMEKSEGGWWYIQIDGHEGWAPAAYIEKAGTQPQTTSAAPPPPPQTNKSKLHSNSREDLTKDDDTPKRFSAMDGLKGALKAKLPHKDKGPPAPPKKDFLTDDDDDDDTDEWDEVDEDDLKDFTPKPAGMAVKPGLPAKSLNRGNLQAPPPPPPQGAKTGTKPEVKTDSRPLPPVKAKVEASHVPKAVNKSDDEEERGAVNVAGLAGALKAKFEGKTNNKSGPPVPPVTQKPKTDQKPTPPSPPNKQKPTPPTLTQKPTPPGLAHKPKAEVKPTPPSFAHKPKLDTKPTPPAINQKPNIGGNKPVLNKVEFPKTNTGDSGSPGKPFGNKPQVNASKPAWAKHDNESASKPSWVKGDSDSNTKPSWAKHDNDSSSKPSWAKHDDNSATKPSWAKHKDKPSLPKKDIDSAAASKPSWAKHDNDNATKPSWAKHDNDNATKPSPKPAWAKKDVEKAPKPAWAKPDKADIKPSWKKDNSDSKTDRVSSSGVETGSARVSDLASVLKSKFENKGKADSDSSPTVSPSTANKRDGPPPLPSSGNKPVTDLKPKPGRPSTPPSARKSNPKPGSTKLDPSKYSARPLPPQPGKPSSAGSPDPNTSNKPLPSLPSKPKGGARAGISQSPRKDSDSDDDARPMGVSGLANALKAKLGAQKGPAVNTSSPDPASKALPSVPAKNTTKNIPNKNADLQNNNNIVSTENVLNAIADYDAGNDGEMSLVLGQQYELLEKADGWWYVSSGSQEGWAPADYLEHSRKPGMSDRSNNVQSVPQKQSVFRTCSDFSAENEGEISVPRGQDITVLDTPEGGWWFVQYNGNEGWVPETYLEQV